MVYFIVSPISSSSLLEARILATSICADRALYSCSGLESCLLIINLESGYFLRFLRTFFAYASARFGF